MPTITSRRLNPKSEVGNYRSKGGFNQPFVDGQLFFETESTSSWKPVRAEQVTTSFRTGSRFSGDSIHDDVLLSGGTWAEATRSITRNPWRKTSRTSKHDTGHPFITVARSYSNLTVPEWSGPGYEGPLVPNGAGVYLSHDNTMDDLIPAQPSLVAQGVQAIRDTLPDKSPAALAQTLIELKREGLPQVKRTIEALFNSKTVRELSRNAGRAHLTNEFGLKPLVSDLRASLEVVQNGERILAEYEDGAGKRQHRQREFPTRTYTDHYVRDGFSPENKVTDVNVIGEAWMGLDSQFGSHSTTTRTVSFTDKFKGAYVYHLPEMFHAQNLGSALEKISYLTGAEPSYSLLWELTPWSWLSDWVINIGDNLAVAESLRGDGLVLLYGYMMRHESHHVVRTVYGLRERSTLTPVGPCSVTYRYDRKERIRATPYGFGLNTDGFTARQWSILGALGMTKGSHSLRLSD